MRQMPPPRYVLDNEQDNDQNKDGRLQDKTKLWNPAQVLEVNETSPAPDDSRSSFN